MKNLMKNIINKLTNIPIYYTLVLGVVLIFLIFATVQGQISIFASIGILIALFLVYLQAVYGSTIIKSVLAVIVLLYSASLYTSTVMSIHGNVVEPFMLTVAAVTLFLSQTYNKKHINYGLRSRALWSSVLALTLASVKMAFILTDYSFILTEVIGLNILIVYIALWRVWTNNSKKTKINVPIVEKEEIIEKFKFIHINNSLDVQDKTWIGDSFDKKNSNAAPYIYSEVIKADEENLNVVFLDETKTDRIYDIGEVKIHKAKALKFMYIQAKEKHYLPDALEGFAEEILRSESSI